MQPNDLVYKARIIGKTKEGKRREMELMKDKCLTCIFLKGVKYCKKAEVPLSFSVIHCNYYTVIQKLDTYLNQGVTSE